MTEWGVDPEFTLVVNSEGVRFTEVYGVPSALKQELLNTTYPSPEAAEEAATGRNLAEEGEIGVLHAVAICTHFDNVISFGGGSRRHVTDFRKHDTTASGVRKHYTVTKHQQWISGLGWITRERFYYSATRSYCGCG